MPIFKTARFQLKPDATEKCEGAIREFLSHVEKNEAGTLTYVSLRDKSDGTKYLHVMAFKDAAAEQAHKGTDALKSFTETLYPETVDGVDFTDFDPVF